MTLLRPTVRFRLTVLYGLLFLAAGAVLLTLNYALVRSSLPQDNIVFSTDAQMPGKMGTSVGGDPPVGAETDVVIVNGAPQGIDYLQKLPNKVRADALHTLMVESGIGLGVMSVVSVLVGWVMAGRALRPLHQITATARRLSDENLDERIAMAGPDDELKELADTFDDMLDRLSTGFNAQRRFIANASHELRTPLAIMRTEIDVALRDGDAGAAELRSMAERVLGAGERAERLIDSLLLLARSEQQAANLSTREPSDIASAAELAVAHTRTLAADNHVRVDTSLASAPVIGDADLLEHLATNLVENAVRYNASGTEAWVRVSTGIEGTSAVLRVENPGAPMAADVADSMFEPFRRLLSGRGAGLGLSIVRSVARAHGGDVTAVPRAAPDGGLVVTARVPAAL